MRPTSSNTGSTQATTDPLFSNDQTIKKQKKDKCSLVTEVPPKLNVNSDCKHKPCDTTLSNNQYTKALVERNFDIYKHHDGIGPLVENLCKLMRDTHKEADCANDSQVLLNYFTNLIEYVESLLQDRIAEQYPQSASNINIENEKLREKISAVEKAFYTTTIFRTFIALDRPFINALVEFIGGSKCIEICAGNGCLAKALHDEGVNISATDNFSETLYNSFPYFRKAIVQKNEALVAVESFANTLRSDEIGYIIACFPELDDKDLSTLFSQILKTTNLKLILIEVALKVFKHMFYRGYAVDYISKKLNYTKTTREEEVYLISNIDGIDTGEDTRMCNIL